MQNDASAGASTSRTGRPEDDGLSTHGTPPQAGHGAGDEGMCVLERRVYRGPNPYGYRPVIRLKLALGQLEEYPTDRLPGFMERLLELLPTLHEHGCSYGEPGGFVRRLRDGTWLAHVAEHIAIELQCLAATPVTYGKTRGAGEGPGVYNVVYSYLEEHVGLLAGWMALRLVDHLLPAELRGVERLDLMVPDDTAPLVPPEAPFDFKAEMEALIRAAERLALGPTTQSLVDEACSRGTPAIRLDDPSLVQLGYRKYQQRIRASVTSKGSHIAVENEAGNIACGGSTGVPGTTSRAGWAIPRSWAAASTRTMRSAPAR